MNMARDSGNTVRNGIVVYPKRYQLDIVSSIEFYESCGVHQVFIIVMRDQQISQHARYIHCTNLTLLQQEEDVGKDIITRAIDTYLLGNNQNGNASNGDRTGDFINGRRRLTSPLPYGNNVVLVSYESLMTLGQVYVKSLYKALDIESGHVPNIKDGNAKYIIKTPPIPAKKGANRLIRRGENNIKNRSRDASQNKKRPTTSH